MHIQIETFHYLFPPLIFPCLSSEEPEVFIAERLFSSSLVAVVAAASPRTLRIEHFKKVLPQLHIDCLPDLAEWHRHFHPNMSELNPWRQSSWHDRATSKQTSWPARATSRQSSLLTRAKWRQSFLHSKATLRQSSWQAFFTSGDRDMPLLLWGQGPSGQDEQSGLPIVLLLHLYLNLSPCFSIYSWSSPIYLCAPLPSYLLQNKAFLLHARNP